eukprot:2089374-Rhodomonas_salina.3
MEDRLSELGIRMRVPLFDFGLYPMRFAPMRCAHLGRVSLYHTCTNGARCFCTETGHVWTMLVRDVFVLIRDVFVLRLGMLARDVFVLILGTFVPGVVARAGSPLVSLTKESSVRFLLRACYAMSDTDIAYGRYQPTCVLCHVRLRACYAMPCTETAYAGKKAVTFQPDLQVLSTSLLPFLSVLQTGIALRVPYAMPGTDIPHARSLLHRARY